MLYLRDALGVGAREVVALVGAGGKTTALFTLARELRAAGAGVVVTTTTKIFVPPRTAGYDVVVEARRSSLMDAVARVVGSGGVAVPARGVSSEGKLEGLPPEWIGDLASLDGITHVLVEADGAARRPITAPRDGEPVIPPSATLVVAVVGVDAVGHSANEVAHRPERVTTITRIAADVPLDARAVARVMLDADGNTRGAPANARIVALVNKADDAASLANAREVADELRRGGIARIVIAALASARPVVEMRGDQTTESARTERRSRK